MATWLELEKALSKADSIADVLELSEAASKTSAQNLIDDKSKDVVS